MPAPGRRPLDERHQLTSGAVTADRRAVDRGRRSLTPSCPVAGTVLQSRRRPGAARLDAPNSRTAPATRCWVVLGLPLIRPWGVGTASESLRRGSASRRHPPRSGRGRRVRLRPGWIGSSAWWPFPVADGWPEARARLGGGTWSIRVTRVGDESTSAALASVPRKSPVTTRRGRALRWQARRRGIRPDGAPAARVLGRTLRLVRAPRRVASARRHGRRSAGTTARPRT